MAVKLVAEKHAKFYLHKCGTQEMFVALWGFFPTQLQCFVNNFQEIDVFFLHGEGQSFQVISSEGVPVSSVVLGTVLLTKEKNSLE